MYLIATIRRLSVAMLAAGLLTMSGSPAFAADLPGCEAVPDVPGHCDIKTLIALVPGTYTTPAALPVLHVLGPGELKVAGGATLTLNIAGRSPRGAPR